MSGSIKNIKGIGPKRAALFGKLNIHTVYDLVYKFPVSYEDRTRLSLLCELKEDEKYSFTARLAGRVTELNIKKNFSIQKAPVEDESASADIIWYNQPFIKNMLKPGNRYFFYGKVKKTKNSIEIDNPWFTLVENEEDIIKNAVILPIYSLTEGLGINVLRDAVKHALDLFEYESTLPGYIESKYDLCDIEPALRNIHFPKNGSSLEKARKRLVFEEFFYLKLGLLHIKEKNSRNIFNIIMKPPQEEKVFFDNLPFTPTQSQKKVLKEIRADMTGKRIMNRLILGDVGSGKTLIAAYALFIAVKNGYQALFMVPTGILAVQQFEYINDMLSGFSITTVLLTGQMKTAERKKIQDDIKSRKVDVIVGTHALISENTRYNNVGLVITDEQHRFGVEQREMLYDKGGNPHVLVMTATPIPRTAAGTIYGDYDVSIIDEIPNARNVKTYVVDESYRERINKFILSKLKNNVKVYVICPAVDDLQSNDIRSAVEMEKILSERFVGFKVGLVHGRMTLEEKDRALADFKKGSTKILVSTVVVEVGVHIPEAGLMVIENAERFGLAQLHQLRGRIGRGGDESWCILFNQGDTDISKERLDIIKTMDNGFDIAHRDLELRGPGEFFGNMQHGRPDFKIAIFGRDDDILKIASKAAEEVINEDPQLIMDKNSILKEMILKQKFSKN